MFGKNRSYYYVNHGNSGQMVYGRPEYLQTNPKYFSRNQQPYPYQAVQPNLDWYPYQQQNLQPQQGYNSFSPVYQSDYVQQQPHYSTQQYPPKDAQFLFQNPLQPQEQTSNPYFQNVYPIMNPYPKQSGVVKQPGGLGSLINSFKAQDGTVDINKMVNTAGQMVNAVSQVSSLVKGFGGMFKV
jgi:YppG-like protein